MITPATSPPSSRRGQFILVMYPSQPTRWFRRSSLDDCRWRGARDDADRAVVFEHRDLHVAGATDAGAPQRGGQLVMRQHRVLHHVFEDAAIVDDHLRPPF